MAGFTWHLSVHHRPSFLLKRKINRNIFSCLCTEKIAKKKGFQGFRHRLDRIRRAGSDSFFLFFFFGETDPALSSAVSQLQRMEHGGCLQLSLFIAHLHSNDKRVFIPPTLYPPLKIMQIFTSFCVSTHQSMALEMLYNFAKSKRIAAAFNLIKFTFTFTFNSFASKLLLVSV